MMMRCWGEENKKRVSVGRGNVYQRCGRVTHTLDHALRPRSSPPRTLHPYFPLGLPCPSDLRGDFCRRHIPQTMSVQTITILEFRTSRAWVGSTLATKRRANARKGQLRQVYLESNMTSIQRT